MPENIIGKIQTEICKHEGEHGCSPLAIELGFNQPMDLLFKTKGIIRCKDITKSISELEEDNIFGAIKIKVANNLQDCLFLVPNKELSKSIKAVNVKLQDAKQ